MPEVATELQTYRFDQMAVQVKDKIHPDEADVDRYVGLEHIDPESLKIRRWGEPSDVESTKILFRAGDIIFGKRRAYQRKLAVADFDGICSAHAMVLRPKTDVVLKEFLPFFMQTDTFMERAVKISVGGLSPTINWKDLAKEEFALPPIEEQQSLALLYGSFSKSIEAIESATSAATTLRASAEDSLCLQGEEDCEHVSLGDCLSHVMDFRGRTPKKLGMEWGGNIPALSAMNVLMDRLDLSKDTKYGSRELYDRWMTQGKLVAGDILFTTEAPLGNICLLDQDGQFILSQRVIALRANADRIDPYFLNAVMRTSFFRRELDRRTTGTTAKGIRVASLVEIPIRVPPMSAQRRAVTAISETKCAIDRLDARHRLLRSMMRSHLNSIAVTPRGSDAV